jgi:hypothetical protein
MNLRRFNSAGMAAFSKALAECRESPALEPPLRLLEDEELTSIVTPAISVTAQKFKNRREAAEYLRDLLKPLSEADVTFDAGLWTWLTLFFFDQVCPPRDGKRSVKNSYYYIYEPRSQRYFYRHLLFIAWRIITSAPTINRLLLETSLSSLDQVTDSVLKRLFLTRIPCIYEVLDRIYWDPERRAPRRGITDSKRIRPGNLRYRFPIRIRQLEMTYDLQSLNADQLIELLGAEFEFDKQRTDGTAHVESNGRVSRKLAVK